MHIDAEVSSSLSSSITFYERPLDGLPAAAAAAATAASISSD